MSKQPVKEHDSIVKYLTRKQVSFVDDGETISLLNHLAVIPITSLDDAICLLENS
jgi:hypothetical protein